MEMIRGYKVFRPDWSCRPGGGFKQYSCPGRFQQDGVLDVLIVKKMALGQVSTLGLRALTRKMTNHPKVKHFQTKRIRIESASKEDVSVDFDGQTFGNLPIDLSIVPGALKLIVP